jgi:EAL domain-containing protein (putative c-di-GMP-specific phosphodiesterase class I)
MEEVAVAAVDVHPKGLAITRDEGIAFSELLDRRNLKPAYQPVVDLITGELVGAEALARWPQLGVTPGVAFGRATQEGRLADLDEVCRTAAIDDALKSSLPVGFRLFVNLEPSVVVAGTAGRLIEKAAGQVDLVVEITERALLKRPAELLRAIPQFRDAGCGIALDDVGAVPDSLALLSLVAPDVIKLDISLVQGWPDVRQAAILTAVAAYAERTGATILAEGVETEAQLQQALALGAVLGQGWYFSHPGPLGPLVSPRRTIRLREPLPAAPRTPFDLVDPGGTRIGPKGLLLGISRHLENQGLALESPPIVAAAFEEARHFTVDTALRYARLADRCPLVAALGVGMPTEPIPGVRGVSLPSDDPLRGEWVVAVVGTHYTGALIAKDLGDSGPDRERRFAFTLTHDHTTVLATARSLLDRIQPIG